MTSSYRWGHEVHQVPRTCQKSCRPSVEPTLNPGWSAPKRHERAQETQLHFQASGREKEVPDLPPELKPPRLCCFLIGVPSFRFQIPFFGETLKWPGLTWRKAGCYSVPAEPEWPDQPGKLTGGRALAADDLGEADGMGEWQKGEHARQHL